MSARFNNAEYLRRLRSEAVANGLCQQCRCRPQKTGRVTCEHCLSKAYERDAAYKAVGLCECGREPLDGHARCGACIERSDAQALRYRERHIALGLCVMCPQPAKDGRRMCEKHLRWNAAKTRRIQNAYYAVGLCGCGKEPRPGRSNCAGCADAVAAIKKRQYESRVSERKCVRCGQPSTPGYRECQPCRETRNEYQRAYKRRKSRAA